MASQVSSVLDDTLDVFSFGGGAWKTSKSPRWFNGSTQYPAFAVSGNGLYGTVNLTFNGTSIGFYGNTNPLAPGLNVFTVSIDGEVPSNYTYVNPNTSQTWQQWYQSPTLSSGAHRISLGQIYNPAMDVAIVKTSNDTLLPQQLVLVEDDDSAISYSGSWKKSEDVINSDNTTRPLMIPMNNSTTRSTTEGDSMTFHFSGTSATIWGVQTTSTLGVLSATYTLDGVPIGKDYSVQSSNSGYKSGQGQVPNNALFSTGTLSQGNHILMLTINKCVNQTFILDYITYMPLGLPNSTSTGSGSSSGTKAPIGAIVGGVLGVIALFLVILAFIFFRRQRQRQGALPENAPAVFPVEGSYTDAAPQGQAIHPFVVPSSSSEHSFPRSQSQSEFVSMTKPSVRTRSPGSTMQTAGSFSMPLHKRMDSGLSAAGSSSFPARRSTSGSRRGGSEDREVGSSAPPAYHDVVVSDSSLRPRLGKS